MILLNKIRDRYYTLVDDVRDFIDDHAWLQLKVARLNGIKHQYIHKVLCHYGKHDWAVLRIEGENAIVICLPCGVEGRTNIIEAPKKKAAKKHTSKKKSSK